MSDVFAALADPHRRSILMRLAARPLPVHEIAAPFAISRPAVSKHLHILREAGLVVEQKQGRERLYRLQADRLAEVREWIAYFDRFWIQSLQSLKELVEE